MRDCVIVGGGPAGLTAAIYLARYHLSVVLFDNRESRAASIPLSHNHAGFPEGVRGVELLDRMRSQARKYRIEDRQETVVAAQKVDGTFIVTSASGVTHTRTILLATGVVNRQPEMPAALHDEAVARGLLRYCPVCDGFEVTDRKVGVIGCGARAYKEALFLRSYTKHITLLPTQAEHGLVPEQVQRLKDLGIDIASGPVVSIELERDTICIKTSSANHRFASVYPALGSGMRSGLARMLGARLSDEGCVVVDGHQRTSVRGLYAAGDVVIGLDQISNAMGQAGVAATAIRNDLCEVSTLLR